MAIEYSYRFRKQFPEAWVLWVHASNAARFEESIREIADWMKIPGRTNPSNNIFKLVYDRLCERDKGRWLLILDNLDNLDDAEFFFEPPQPAEHKASGGQANSFRRPLSKYFPVCSHGSTMVTTRSHRIARRLVDHSKIITVNAMDKEQALTLLGKKLGSQIAVEDAAQLAVELDYMPLAMVQAAAYIRQRMPRCSVRQYIDKFRRSDRGWASLLHGDAGGLRRDNEANESIILTWQVSFEHIRHLRPSAADLLSLMSFYDRQGIPECLLRDREPDFPDAPRSHIRVTNETTGGDSHSESSSQDEQFELDIQMLRDYSFLSLTTEGTAFQVHRLVQRATRRWLESQGKLREWEAQSILSLDTNFPCNNWRSWRERRFLLPHAIASADLTPEDWTIKMCWAALLYKASTYMSTHTTEFQYAAKLAYLSLKTRKEEIGELHPISLSTHHLLINILLWGGQYEDAEREIRISMTQTEQLLTQDFDWSVRDCLLENVQLLIRLYLGQKDWDEAQMLCQNVLDMMAKDGCKDRHYGVNLRLREALALAYFGQGRLLEAEQHLTQAVEFGKSRSMTEDDETMLSFGVNLTQIYWTQGRLDQAEEVQKRVTETARKFFGDDYPFSITAMSRLAELYRAQDKIEEAEQLDGQIAEAKAKFVL